MNLRIAIVINYESKLYILIYKQKYYFYDEYFNVNFLLYNLNYYINNVNNIVKNLIIEKKYTIRKLMLILLIAKKFFTKYVENIINALNIAN